MCVFYPGDQLESVHCSPDILRLQDPKNICEILSRKFSGSHVVYVSPSRLEAGFACFDHFLTGTTIEGDPKEYNGAAFRASSQLAALLKELRAQGRIPPASQDAAASNLILAGFSKGGIVLNQILHEMAAAADPASASHVSTPLGSAVTPSRASSRAGPCLVTFSLSHSLFLSVFPQSNSIT